MFCLSAGDRSLCLVLTYLDALQTCFETGAMSCVLSPGVFNCAITFWVGFSLVMFANISESLHDRAHILAYSQWRAIKCSWSPIWGVLESVLFLSEISIQLVLSVLIWCLFLNPALAVRGRRLLASWISSHPDAVLSVFVSQCTGPHFLVDESRVPVCAGSNSVSFQHPTILWDGRKSSCLLVQFFTWVLLLRIYQLPVIPRGHHQDCTRGHHQDWAGCFVPGLWNWEKSMLNCRAVVVQGHQKHHFRGNRQFACFLVDIIFNCMTNAN